MTTRCALLSMGRTGSTLLVGLLNSHPQITFKGELFNPFKGDSLKHPELTTREYLEAEAFRADTPIAGFKMPLDWIFVKASVVEHLRDMGARVILLRRGHVLQHFVSSMLAGLNNDFDSERPYPKQELTVDPWQLAAFIGTAHYGNHMLKQMTQGMERFEITYEELSAPAVQANLLRFLGAEVQPLAAATTRQRTRPLREVITNYDDLARFFAPSPYAWMFRDHATDTAAI